MPFDHQVLYPLHDKGWALRNQLWEHSYCLGSTSNILAWCCGHLGICPEIFCHFTKLCFCSCWCKIRMSPFVMWLLMDRILYQTQMNEWIQNTGGMIIIIRWSTLGEKSVSLPLGALYIPHCLSKHKTCISTVPSQWLTVWAKAWLCQSH